MRALGWVAAAVLAVLAIVVAYVVTNSAALIERAVERYGARYLGVPVTVTRVDVDLTEGDVTLHGLAVGNPRGFSGPPAMQLAEVRIAVDLRSTSSQIIVLEDVAVDDATVNALVRGRDSNLQQILDHLNREIAAHQRAQQTRVASEVKLVIDRFAFAGGTATVESDLLGRASVELPPVHLTDVGREDGGGAIGQVLRQLLEPILRSVVRGALERGIDLPGVRQEREERARQRFGDRLDGALDRFTDQPGRED